MNFQNPTGLYTRIHRAFEDNLASADYKNPETGYRKYIDVTSFIDYMLSTEFCHNVDGYRLSTIYISIETAKIPDSKHPYGI